MSVEFRITSRQCAVCDRDVQLGDLVVPVLRAKVFDLATVLLEDTTNLIVHVACMKAPA